MKMRNTSLLLLFIFIVSCSYDFDLGDMDATAKLVLYCMPNANSDTTLIQLYRSLPVAQQRKAGKEISNAHITFTVNGKEQTVHYAEIDKYFVRAGCYYVIGRWKETDIIRVSAEADGLPAVCAETTIPTSFPLKKVDMVLKQNIDNKLQFRITFQDKGKESFYGIRIVKKVVYEDLIENENSSIYTETLDLELDDEPLLNNKTGLDATFDYSTNFYQYLYIWSNEQILNREYTLRLNTFYSADWEADKWSSSSLHTFYKMYFYMLSPELYKYLKSLNDMKNNELGNKGLAPIRSNYTNIENGIGVLGSCQITETEWLKMYIDNDY